MRAFIGGCVVLGVVFGAAWLARGYTPSYVSTPATTNVIAWPAGATVSYRHWTGNTTATNVTGAASVQTAVDAAYASVNAATGLNFVNAGTSTTTSTGSDGVNLVTYASTAANLAAVGGALAVNVFYFSIPAYQITETDMVWNPAINFTTNGTTGQYDVQSVAAHEAGHGVGLDHSAVCDCTMFPNGFTGSVLPRTFERDDLAGFRHLYPTAPPSASAPLGYGVVTGTVQQAPATAVPGAHVVLVDAITGRIGPSALSRSNGQFTVSGVPVGIYRIYVEPLDGPMSAANIAGSGWSGVAVNSTFRTTAYGGVATPTTFAVKGGLTTAAGTITVAGPAPTINLLGAFPMATATGGFSFSNGKPVEITPPYTQWIGVAGASVNTLPDAAFTIDSPFFTITGPSTQSGALGGGGGYKIFPVSVSAATPPGGYLIKATNAGETATGVGLIHVLPPASPQPFVQSYGASCPSVGAIALQTINGNPTLGNLSFAAQCTGTTAGRTIAFVLGVAPDALLTGGNFAPAASCTVYVDLNWLLFPFPGVVFTTVGATATQPLPIANLPAYAGLEVFVQCAEIAPAGTIKLSNALLIRIQ
ncbi:MAG TPA: matrixin family metalloprotease [Planctomycetota bacterium]|nr:matrixin family metalloprotease [Planctomycetota bacterium]